jgi:hypothetical protein
MLFMLSYLGENLNKEDAVLASEVPIPGMPSTLTLLPTINAGS